MRDPKNNTKRKITDHFKPADKGKKENARPAASKKRKQVDGHEPCTKKVKGNGGDTACDSHLTALNGRFNASGRGRNASTSKSHSPTLPAERYATPKSMVKGKRNVALYRNGPVIDLTLDDADNRASIPGPTHTIAPPTPASIPEHRPRHSFSSFFSHQENSGQVLNTPRTPIRHHFTYSAVSFIPNSAPTHDSPLNRLSRRHTIHIPRSPSVIPSSQQSQDDEWLALSIARVVTPPKAPSVASQNLAIIPPLAFDRNLPKISSPQPVDPLKDNHGLPEDSVVPTSQSQEICLSQLSPRKIRAGLLFSSYIPKPCPLDIVPTSQSQSEVEITSTEDISWITSRSLDRNFVRSVSSKTLHALGPSQSDPGLDITHFFEDDDNTNKGVNLPATQCTSSTDSDPEYDDNPFSTNPADRPPINLTQNSSATESDPDYDAYPFSTNPADRPTVEEDGDTTIVVTGSRTCPTQSEGSLPNIVKDFRDMFGVGDGSYPDDFPMSLR